MLGKMLTETINHLDKALYGRDLRTCNGTQGSHEGRSEDCE
jgi:hypothetical protein